MSELIILAALILWIMGGAITVMNPMTGEPWKTFTLKPLWPWLIRIKDKLKERAKKTTMLLVLLLAAGAAIAQPGVKPVFNPAENTITLDVPTLMRLETMARKGKLCDEAVTESEALLTAMEAQSIIDAGVISSLRKNIETTAAHGRQLDIQVRKLENELAVCSRDRNIARNELKIMKKQKLYETIQWSAGAAIAVGLVAIMILPRK